MTDVPNGQTVSGLDNVTVHVTGHDESGREYFVSSNKARWQSFGEGALGMSTLYTNDFHADLNGDADIKKHSDKVATGAFSLVNRNGSTLRMVDFAPGLPPMMHRTKSIDFGVCLSGTLEAILGSGEKLVVKPGDIVIQRSTDHGWRNPSDTEWARMCFVLQDIKPVVVNGEKLGEDFHGHDVDIPHSGNDD